jgi:hypothetical protein
VHDETGEIVGFAVQPNTDDVYLVLSDHVLPPE